MVSTEWNERHDVRFLFLTIIQDLTWRFIPRYYIVYVFQGSGLTGTRAGLIAAVSHVFKVLVTQN